MKTELFYFPPRQSPSYSASPRAKQLVSDIENSGGEVKSVQFWAEEGGTTCAILARVQEDYKPPSDTGFL